MEENLKWVWYAFSAAWGLHAAYALSILLRQRRLREQVQDLQSLLEDEDGKPAGD